MRDGVGKIDSWGPGFEKEYGPNLWSGSRGGEHREERTGEEGGLEDPLREAEKRGIVFKRKNYDLGMGPSGLKDHIRSKVSS